MYLVFLDPVSPYPKIVQRNRGSVAWHAHGARSPPLGFREPLRDGMDGKGILEVGGVVAATSRHYLSAASGLVFSGRKKGDTVSLSCRAYLSLCTNMTEVEWPNWIARGGARNAAAPELD